MRHGSAEWRAARRYGRLSLTSETRPEETSIRVLLRDPNYLSFWFVGGFTGVVRWFQLLALGVYTFETTNSPLLVSIIPLLWMLPLALCGPVVGAIADRLNRKMLLAGSIAAITVVSSGMAMLAWAGELAFIHVAIASFLSGIFWAICRAVRCRRRWGWMRRPATRHACWARCWAA